MSDPLWRALITPNTDLVRGNVVSASFSKMSFIYDVTGTPWKNQVSRGLWR